MADSDQEKRVSISSVMVRAMPSLAPGMAQTNSSPPTLPTFAMVVDGADHYLGNLICRLEREETPQHDALKMVNSVSVAFLDAYLKNNSEARAYLAGDAMASTTQQFATLDRR